MKAKQGLSRREFLETTGGTLGLLALGRHFQPQMAMGAEGDPRSERSAPAKLKRLLEKMDAKGYQYWSVPWKDAEFLHLMVKVSRAKQVLEVGTSHGFSAIWMGLALEETGGRLTTIEIDRERVQLARKNVGEAGLSQRITFVAGDAHAEVAKIEGPFDFVFLDADKGGETDYFRKLYPKKLLPGAIIAVHNAISQARAMKEYLEMARRHPDFDTVILSLTMDDGICLSYRHRVS